MQFYWCAHVRAVSPILRAKYGVCDLNSLIFQQASASLLYQHASASLLATD